MSDKTQKLKELIESYLDDWDDFVVKVTEDDEELWNVEVTNKNGPSWKDYLTVTWSNDGVDFMIDTDGSNWELTEVNFWKYNRFESEKGNR